MDKIPFEILAAILRTTVLSTSKNAALNLRFVCRAFDTALKPVLCQTLNLEFTRISRFSHRRPPMIEGLQTIGYHCTSLYIDLMLLRDELEVGFLNTLFREVPSMREFCDTLQTRYCMNTKSFTEEEYRAKVTEILFYCSRVERVRLNLPFPLVGPHCTAVTSTLANTFAALGRKEDEESEHSKLKVLVLENAADISICRLWTNPIDVNNIRVAMEQVEHFVISIRRREPLIDRFRIYSASLWSLIASAGRLKTLCLVGLDCDYRPPKAIKHTLSTALDVDEWAVMALPNPRLPFQRLSSLELKRVEISADFFASAGVLLGTPFASSSSTRASRLGYDFYGTDDELVAHRNFDLDDPRGFKRCLSRRFVEVVTGLGKLGPDSGDDHRDMAAPSGNNKPWALETKPVPPKPVRPSEWDTVAYQSLVANPTSTWLRSIDDTFPNCNKGTLDELHAIAQTACTGMNKLTEHRSSLSPETANALPLEHLEDLVELPPPGPLQQVEEHAEIAPTQLSLQPLSNDDEAQGPGIA
ncbi:unnamed protein product [Parascedosporium putredinis]|uniref:Uncharacterized protein n=1 Tax=Parascedosporium putredinis TaxID=1442378 RepID=A0A9P1H692_9PEZI|nr:unnamed protein product [Parascedosporium putredinis]CAI7998482.1 unnamed protein product [Parascedosporium putredinis]